MIKKFICLFMALLFFAPTGAVCFAVAELSLSAQSAILINSDTGEVLYAKNEHIKRGIASTTKIMTSLLAIESKKLNTAVKITDNMVRIEGTSIGLKAGYELTLCDLTYGMLLESGNDAANAAAIAVAGSMDSFVELMNRRAKELGMTETAFKNPSGLTADGHYSTAFDMALLASAAVKNSTFLKICSSKSYSASYKNPDCIHMFSNHNKLLSSYEGAVGLKTGFTKKSGRCLVSAAVRNGVTLVAVTLNAYDDWNDHKKLLDYGFSVTKRFVPQYELSKLSVAVVGSDKKTAKVEYAVAPSVGYCDKSIVTGLTAKVYCAKFLYAPVKIGDVVGKIAFKNKSGKTVFEVNLVSAENIACASTESAKKKLSILEKFKKFIKGLSSRQT